MLINFIYWTCLVLAGLKKSKESDGRITKGIAIILTPEFVDA